MNYARFFNLLLLANRDSIKSQIEKKQIDRNRSRFDLYRLYDEVHEKAAPCFVLSTGRCGTMLLDKIFNKHSQIRSFHEPSPELVYFSKYAYIHHADHDDQLRMLVDGARYDVIRDSYMLDKMYTETNNRITFFAYQLTTLYPRARFVHLVRHPFRFIESGLKRQWYSGIHLHDEGRIVPADPKAVGWEKIERIEKIAWLWNETNAFIESFKQVHSERVHTILAEELFSDPSVSMKLFEFLGMPTLPQRKLRSIIRRPINAQPGKSVLAPDANNFDKIKAVTPLRTAYGYEIE